MSEQLHTTIADIQLYDEAVMAYLKQIHPKVYFATTDTAKPKNAKDNKDSTSYPFISFYRDPDLHIDESRANNSGIVDGDLTKRAYKASPDDKLFTFEYVHSIPVNLMYQVDIWAARQRELLALSQDVLIDLRSARRVLYVPINPDGEMGRFAIDDVTLTDNSDLESETETGKVYRHTLSFVIEAYIKRVRRPQIPRFNPNVSIDIYE